MTYYIEFDGETRDVSFVATSDQEAVLAALRRPDGNRVVRVYRRPTQRRELTVYEGDPVDTGDLT